MQSRNKREGFYAGRMQHFNGKWQHIRIPLQPSKIWTFPLHGKGLRALSKGRK